MDGTPLLAGLSPLGRAGRLVEHSSNEAHSDGGPLPPGDLAIALVADFRLQDKFARAEKRVARHDLCAELGDVEYLTSHRAVPAIEDNQGAL
jgi:hypothetical protein